MDVKRRDRQSDKQICQTVWENGRKEKKCEKDQIEKENRQKNINRLKICILYSGIPL